MDQESDTAAQHIPWNKGRLVGQKLPFPSQLRASPHRSTRQYSRIVDR